MMRGLWYVFDDPNDEDCWYACVADRVQEVIHGPGGWLVCFRGTVPNKFLSRRRYSPPYLMKRKRT